MKKIFKLFKFYSPLFEKILKKYNLPKELKYLPIIESNLNSKITSSLGAKGLWQFMSETAQIYGLTKNSLYDERNDPTKSTEAAAQYLKDLYNHFNNWTLVIAAYNCGSNIIDHAINNQKTRNFWKFNKVLPKQTRNYIPKFIAINYIMNQYYKENYIKYEHLKLKFNENKIISTIINKKIYLDFLAKKFHIKKLFFLNPKYNLYIISKGKQKVLNLPRNKLKNFYKKRNTNLY